MKIVEFSFAIIIGMSLGLIGGGGSILTVPVLVYIAGIEPMLATFYSLFIVGMTALIGALHYIKKDLVDLKVGLLFGIPSLAAVFVSRGYILPSIPNHLIFLNSIEIYKSHVMMILFAVLMIVAATYMIKQKKTFKNLGSRRHSTHLNYKLIIFQGTVVGVLTGILGAGGGFLIIPALVLWGSLPMKKAIGTSLIIIAVNSSVGFMGGMIKISHIDWTFLINFSCFAFIGIFLGIYLNKYFDNAWLRSCFGWVTLAMGAFIIIKEAFYKIQID